MLKIHQITNIQKFKDNYNETVFQTDFGADIRIMRLYNGRILDIEEFQKVESSSEEEQIVDD